MKMEIDYSLIKDLYLIVNGSNMELEYEIED